MISFKKFDIFSSSKDQWDMFHKYRHEYHQEDSPEDPMMNDKASEEHLKGQMKNLGMNITVYGIFHENEELIGNFVFGFFTETSPSYIGNEKFAFMEIEILKRHRRKRIATKALTILVDSCEKNGKEIIMCNSHIPEAKLFYEAIGAKIAQVQVENRLSLSKIDWNMITNWITEGEQKNPSSKIIVIEGKIPDNIVEAFVYTFSETAKLQPKDDLEMGDMSFTVDDLRKNEQTEELSGTKTLTALVIEEDGKISSVTQLKIFPGKEKLIQQGLTGVPLEFRGRKLGKWVKAKLLLYVKEKYPATETVVTGNAESNAPMLYINEKLGFRKYKENVMAQVRLSQLQTYLKSKKIENYTVNN
jgi:RimJ/RimL family protein N-acetyltransferase